MSRNVRVMLCDDSAVMRRLIRDTLARDPHIQVVYEAKHGRDAVENILASHPDVVVMDVEMPVMDGIDAVRAIRAQAPKLPVIMFSSLTSRGAESTLDAMAAGANDFATKPTSSQDVQASMDHVGRDLIPKIRQWSFLGNVPAASRFRPTARRPEATVRRTSGTPLPKNSRIDLVAVGVSTGGPEALTRVLRELPSHFPVPIVIVQHMPPVFTRLLAERLSVHSNNPVREAVTGDELQPGTVLVAPGDFHLVLQRVKTRVCVATHQGPHENSCRPSVDVLFRSVAECYGHQSLAVVLTGMGNDGTNGVAAIKQRGGLSIAQDEATSTVWGMPGQVVKSGLADKILPIGDIGKEITAAVTMGRRLIGLPTSHSPV